MLLEGQLYVVESNSPYLSDATTWGRIQLILGVTLLLVGLAGWLSESSASPGRAGPRPAAGDPSRDFGPLEVTGESEL